MCCFSGQVRAVSRTKIFARLVSRTDQVLAYGMRLETPEDVAMILPLPVVPGSGEDAVSFIDLSAYPTLFQDLASGFPRPRKKSYALSAGAIEPKPALKVQQVGSFEASFVPTIADFERLDKRFRLPDGTWEKIPAYRDYGFAVFKLRKGKLKVHPMAFRFPSRLAAEARLFFPTVHIHDGLIHSKETFDHQLFAQAWPGAGLSSREGWRESEKTASHFAEIEKARGLLWGKGHVYLREIRGLQNNGDVKPRAIAL